MRDYKARYYDMDGTLIETGAMWKETIQESLSAHHITLSREEQQLAASIPLQKILIHKGIPVEKIYAIYATLSQLVSQRVQQGAIQWREGAEEILAASPVPQAIITSSSSAFFNMIDAKLDLRSRVQAVITGDDVEGKYKPDPRGIYLACAQLNVPPRDVIMIGDQQCDVDAAMNAGADSVLIRGSHTPERITHTKVVITFRALQAYFKRSYISAL